MVDIRPYFIPKAWCRTLTIGAKQFVVQDALDIMLWDLGSYLLSFTPMTIVISSPLAGADIITFLVQKMWLIHCCL